MKAALDPVALEASTQAIGKELFSAARQVHAHLSVLNRWTSQVLSWCLGDASVKGSVLRFLDTLPSLKDSRDVARHIADYFPNSNLRLPVSLRLGSKLAGSGLLTHRALDAVVRQMCAQVARQFIAESDPKQASEAIRVLAGSRAACSLDILGEQVLSESDANAYASQCGVLLRIAADVYQNLGPGAQPSACGSLVNLSVKPSGLTPKFDPASLQASLERAWRRLLPIVEQADSLGALVNLDMEQYALRDLTLQLAKRVLLHPDRNKQAELGIVIQAYLRDSESVADELLQWLASHERMLTVRLVKGAYWDSEMAIAGQSHWPSPAYRQKEETDAAFERLTQKLLAAGPLLTTAIASHNVRSIAHAMACAEMLGVQPNQMEFQLLFGMGDALQGAILSRGYPVRIYTPVGELIPGMAYLVRRILENTANESFLRQEITTQSPEKLLRAPESASEKPTKQAEALYWKPEPLTNWALGTSRENFAQALKTVSSQLGRDYSFSIGHDLAQASSTLEVRNPANPAQVIGRVGKAAVADVHRAVELASRAQKRWALASVGERTGCLRKAADLMRRQREALAAQTVLEVGKTWGEADIEIVEAIEYLEYYSSCMERLTETRVPDQAPGERNSLRFYPRGVAAVIAPWNFPAAILTGMTAAALVTGNAVVQKPSEESSIIALLLAAILHEAGVPQDILQCLPGEGESVGKELVRHPGVQTVLFTGSKAVGLSIIEACGRIGPGQRFVKHAVVEMGGKNAVIVDADADCDAAVSGIMRSAFGFAGQKCSAASRLVIHEAVYEKILNRLIAATDRLIVGDPADPDTDMGPLINEAASKRLKAAMAYAESAKRLAYAYPAHRMPASGYFVGPAIAAGLPLDDRLSREELFGPLLCVFKAKSFEESLRIANDTEYALTGGVYSRLPSHIQQAIDSFDVGNLYINRPITGAMVGRQPFGGHRLSGLGTKAGGPDYLLQLVTPKTICANMTRHGMPLEE